MVNLQYGMPTLIEVSSLEETAALCRELGLAFIELNMNLPQYADLRETKQLAEVANAYGITYTVHLDGFLNPCDFNQTIAKAYTDIVLQTIEAAKELHIPLLNMHLPSGDCFTLPDRKVNIYDAYEDICLTKFGLFRDALTEAIADTAMKICVENTRTFQQKFGADGLAALLESPAFGVTFDSGHDAANSFMQRPIIDRHIDRLCHMHLHDAIPEQRRDHLPLGAGNLDISRYLDLAREHNCRVLLETKTVAGLKQSVAWLKERNYL
jgi:sugar phosphate isomerase/epimerase